MTWTERSSALVAADDAVEALLDEEWSPGDVALLATGRSHPEQVNAVQLGGYVEYWYAFFAAEDVYCGHVLGFKGLERPVVVVAVNGVRDLERAREMLYTGLSRARSCSSWSGIAGGSRPWGRRRTATVGEG